MISLRGGNIALLPPHPSRCAFCFRNPSSCDPYRNHSISGRLPILSGNTPPIPYGVEISITGGILTQGQ
jgi:hypothetical protein